VRRPVDPTAFCPADRGVSAMFCGATPVDRLPLFDGVVIPHTWRARNLRAPSGTDVFGARMGRTANVVGSSQRL